MEKYRDRGDCSIVRDHEKYKGYAVLMDCDGEVVRSFDGNWTDAQVFEALDFANRAFDAGVKHGQRKKAQEIRKALDVA